MYCSSSPNTGSNPGGWGILKNIYILFYNIFYVHIKLVKCRHFQQVPQPLLCMPAAKAMTPAQCAALLAMLASCSKDFIGSYVDLSKAKELYNI